MFGLSSRQFGRPQAHATLASPLIETQQQPASVGGLLDRRQLGTLDMTVGRDRMQNVELAATNACDDL